MECSGIGDDECDLVRKFPPGHSLLEVPLSLSLAPRSYIGYSNANYALSEVHNPVRTLKRAAPLAIGLVAAVYLLVNWAYVAVVAKSDILGSGRIVA